MQDYSLLLWKQSQGRESTVGYIKLPNKKLRILYPLNKYDAQ